MKKIGILGGSFNPPHIGHVILALEMKEHHNLDEVWLIPAGVNPHKQGLDQQTKHHRLAMIKLAIGGVPGLKVIPYEVEKEGPSYTIDTLRYLKATYPDTQFFLILGDEAYQKLSTWKEGNEIPKLASILIGRRGLNKGEKNRLVEISATEIRDRLKKGLYCGHLVPLKVVDYIKQNHLY